MLLRSDIEAIDWPTVLYIYIMYIVWWLCNHWEVKHYGGVPYKWDRLEQKMASIRKCFWPSHSERFACCALTIQYNICSTVGQSIASISDLGEHIYLGASYLGKYAALVVYIGYGPPYHTIYITYSTMSAQQTNLFCLKTLPKTTPFFPKVDMAYIKPPRKAQVSMVAQSSYYII